MKRLIIGLYMLSVKMYHNKVPVLPGLLSKLLFLISSCDLSYKISVGNEFKLTHPTGVVIGGNTTFGDRVWVAQNVTVGGNFGRSKDGRSFPTIGSNVKIMCGSVVAGPVKIGNNVVIGANSVVTKDIPSGSVVSGVPGKVIRELTEVEISMMKTKDLFAD